MDLLSNLEKLQKLEEEYFKEFIKLYLTLFEENDNWMLWPTSLYEKAIEAEVLLTSLGPTAVKRLQYVGFDLLFAFNNPVDWFHWKSLVKERNINHEIYCSVSVRLQTEFKRMALHLENGSWESYCELCDSMYSKSKERYSKLFRDEQLEKQTLEESKVPKLIQNISIHGLSYNEAVEKSAVTQLEKLHKQAGIWSNVTNVVSTIIKATIGIRP